jgi:hypothetical protein
VIYHGRKGGCRDYFKGSWQDPAGESKKRRFYITSMAKKDDLIHRMVYLGIPPHAIIIVCHNNKLQLQ